MGKVLQLAALAAHRLASALKASGEAIDAWRQDVIDARSRKRLSHTAGYAFTEDWVSAHPPIWQRCLEPFRGRPGVKLLEIGSFQGRSSLWFLEHVLTDATATITCVDTFDRAGREPLFDHNIAVSRLAAKVTKKKGRSEAVLPTLGDQRFDIVYIDGSHDAPNVLMDAFLSWGLLKEGGVIIFDDYEWQPQRPPERRPKMAIDIFLGVLASQIDVLHKEYQVIVRAKPGARAARAA